MNILQAVKRACEEPTLLDAYNWIAIWESERAIKQAVEYYKTGIPTGAYGGWDTCFKICFKEVEEHWREKRLIKIPQGI